MPVAWSHLCESFDHGGKQFICIRYIGCELLEGSIIVSLC